MYYTIVGRDTTAGRRHSLLLLNCPNHMQSLRDFTFRNIMSTPACRISYRSGFKLNLKSLCTHFLQLNCITSLLSETSYGGLLLYCHIPVSDTFNRNGTHMSIKRKLTTIYKPQGQPGFLGRGHTARPVIQRAYADSDPFILLMDDVLDKQDDEPVGGPHPHAGFETVSLLLEGQMGDGEHKMMAGDFQMMTAGSGVIHTETIDTTTRMRLLQLWLNLPKHLRWTTPRVQDLRADHVPSSSQDGVDIRVYSGTLAGLTSPIQNHTPVIIADITIQAHTHTELDIPASYHTFMYVLEGRVTVGEDEKMISKGQVGWLDTFLDETRSILQLSTGEEATRFVLYAGQPQGDPIVSHGPFIGDTQDDIRRLYQEFRHGKMKHISTVPEHQRMLL
jgi:quercetin 2,3-dioxygenase